MAKYRGPLAKPLPPPKKRRWPNPISVQRRADKREYDRLRKKFLADHPICQICLALKVERPKKSTQVHHRRGRRGSNYLNVATWMATDAKHHDEVHRNPKWAREHGFLGSFHHA